jgi:hypothetical protein
MVDYSTANGFSLLTGATDADGDPMTVRRINGSVIDWGANGGEEIVALTHGNAKVYENGIGLLSLSTDANNPDDGVTEAFGSFTFTLWDGADESNTATCTIDVTGQVATGTPNYVTTGLVARWAADEGTTLSGSDVTTWVDSVQGLTLTAVGTPTLGTPPGGTAAATMVIGAGDGFTGSTLTGFPSSASPRTIQAMIKSSGSPFFGGVGYGASSNLQSFVLAFDGSDEITLDYKGVGNNVLSGLQPVNQWISAAATYDGTTIKLYIGDVLVATKVVALTTVNTLINVFRSFSGYTTQGEVGAWFVYGRELDITEIAANNAHLNSRFIGASSVSAPSTPTGSALAETSFTANITANSSFCYLAYSVRTSSTPATESEILAGTSALQFGVVACNGTGAVTIPVTGGAASTGYYVNVIKYGLTGGKSSVVTSSVITTTAAPAVNPVLSAAGMTATGQTTATGTVTTDTGNGTLYYGLMLSGATTPNATQIKAGTDGDDVALIGGLRTKSITATGAQAVSFTSLTASTAYKAAYYQENGSLDPSNVLTATATTDAATAPSTDYTADSTASTAAGLYAILASWVGGANTPAGKTSTETRVAQLTAPVASLSMSGYDFSAITGGVIVRGIGPYEDNATYPYYPTCGSHVSGNVTVTNCTNLQLFGITCQKLVVTGSPTFTYDRVSSHSRWSSTRSIPNVTGPGIDLTGSPGTTGRRSHVGGFNTVSVSINTNMDDFSVESHYVEQWSDDVFKCRQGAATISRGSVRRNWAGRDNLSAVGAHSDFMQNQSGFNPDFEFWGNACIEGSSLNGVSFQGGLWQSNTNVSDNANVQQNIFAIRGQNGLATAGGINDTCQYNDLLYSEHGDHGDLQPSGELIPRITGTFTNLGYNATTRTTSGSANTGGTGSIVFTLGNPFNSAIVVDTSGMVPYYVGFPCEARGIGEVAPVPGSVMDWNYSGQKVASYLRKQEIFELGIHPGNDGWPTAGRFHAEYDPTNTLGSTWNGTYDADGNNAGSSPTTVSIDDLALTLYDSDPHGIDAARITFTGTHDQTGSTLQIKVIDTSDSSTVVDWADLTASSGGVWSAVVDVPRGFRQLKGVVRAKFSTGVTDTQTTGFYVGYIVGIVGQSLAARPLYVAASTATLAPPAKTLWLVENDQNGSSSAGQQEIGSGDILNLRRMATTVAEYFDAPLCIVDLAVSGTSFGGLTNASESTTTPDRSWVQSAYNPVNYIQSRGSDCSILMWHWFTADASVQTAAERWLLPGLAKQTLNGLASSPDASGLQPYTSGAVAVSSGDNYTPVHFLFDLNDTGQGLFDYNRTKFVPWTGHSFFNAQNSEGTYAANDIQKGKYGGAQAEMTQGTGVGQFSLNAVAGWTGQTTFAGHMAAPAATHVNSTTGEEDGEALVAVYMAIAMARAVGAMIPNEPQITAVTDNSTSWDVTISLPHGGNLSTALIEHTAGNYAGSFEATNWQTPTALTESDIPQLHAVQGFAVWTGSTANWTNFTATITNTGTGTVPSRTGTIRVTPSGGSTAGKTLSFGTYDGVNLLTQANANAARVYTHWPLETRAHASGAGYGFPVVRQNSKTAIVTNWL